MVKAVYWYGPDKTGHDDFGMPYGDFMFDGKTKMGPWACMSSYSWEKHGCGKLGTGFGQKYKRQADGRWLKVEG
jgi:hypothetical protein